LVLQRGLFLIPALNEVSNEDEGGLMTVANVALDRDARVYRSLLREAPPIETP